MSGLSAEHNLKSHDHDDSDNEEEEDEDLLSESNTMIFHKLNSPMKKNVSFNINPIEEIRDIQTDKALFTSIFDKYFDESKEGDVDESEFKKGLDKLGVDISDEQLHKLFNVLLMYGDDEDSNN